MRGACPTFLHRRSRRFVAALAVFLFAASGCSEIGETPLELVDNDGGIDAGVTDGGADSGTDAPPPPPPCVEGDARVEGPGGTCYFVVLQPTTWSGARSRCQQDGGDLVVVESTDENILVHDLADVVVQDGRADAWIGGNDIGSEGTFLWLDGAPAFSFEQFRAGEPNDGGDGAGGVKENCMILEADNALREWDDRACGDPYPLICERLP